jgi:hypothetical protein
MRAWARGTCAALGALLAACGPLELPRSSQAQRCAMPCPACPEACLPAGYCSEVTRTAAQLALRPVGAHHSWEIALPGFPSGAEVSVSVRAGFDADDRGGAAPIYGVFGFQLDGHTTSLGGAAEFGSYPVWWEDQVVERTGEDGFSRTTLLVDRCQVASGDAHCLIDGASSFTGRLVSTAGWLEAPLCTP